MMPGRAGRRPDRPEGVVVGTAWGTTPSALDDVLDEFAGCWEAGAGPRAEAFLGRLNPASEDDAVGLIYYEFCRAGSLGLRPDPAAYLGRFPAYRDRLARLFGLHEALGAATFGALAAPTLLPVAGDRLGPFHLLRELGRGGSGRVFLAEEETRGNRLVVLKVSIHASAEPRLLERARHPHIVKMLRHDWTADGALHLICMPFQGGATLAAVLAEHTRRGVGRESGLDLLEDLDRVSDPSYRPTGRGRPGRVILAGSSYSQGVAWIVARLADALDHADRRGVAHGDLKPANVLLTADGQPILLDFDRAVDRGRPAPGAPGLDAGGTLIYMSPERLRDLASSGGLSRRTLDRHRSDLYALGLILREALGGPAPAVPRARSLREQAAALADARSLRPALACAPAGLRPILALCLAPDPANRYARAGELAAGLDRWCASDPRFDESRPDASSGLVP